MPVTAVALLNPAKAAPAPLAGAVKVTVAPTTALLFEFLTVACSAVANTVPAVVPCGVPAVALTLFTTGAVFVRMKLALDAEFATAAEIK